MGPRQWPTSSSSPYKSLSANDRNHFGVRNCIEDQNKLFSREMQNSSFNKLIRYTLHILRLRFKDQDCPHHSSSSSSGLHMILRMIGIDNFKELIYPPLPLFLHHSNYSLHVNNKWVNNLRFQYPRRGMTSSLTLNHHNTSHTNPKYNID